VAAENREARRSTTGDYITEKHGKILAITSQFIGKECPEFSTRWLENFKKRHGIQARIRHGKAGSIPDSIKEEIRSL